MVFSNLHSVMQSVPGVAYIEQLNWQQQVGLGAVGSAVVIWTVHKLYVGCCKPRRSLRGKVVCVTGATSGIGAALLQVLLDRGAKTVITGRNTEALQAAVDQNRQVVDKFTPVAVQFDLSDLDGIPAKSQEILAAYGHVDVLIHNAGISSRGSALENAFSVDFDVMRTNYLAPIAMTKEILPKMIANGGGCLAVISSVQGKLAIPYRSSYSASKHAIQGWFDSVRAELVDDNVDVLMVSPGYVKTNISVRALRGEGASHGKMDEATARGKDAVDVAEEIVRAIERRERDIVVSDFLPKLAIFIRTVWPGLYFSLMDKRARKLRAEETTQ